MVKTLDRVANFVVNKSRQLAVLWLIFVVLFVAFALRSGVNFDSSIIALLPQSNKDHKVQAASDQMAASYANKLLLIVSAADDKEARQGVRQLATRLTELPQVEDILWQIDAQASDYYQQLQPYRYVLLTDKLRELALTEQYQKIAQQALANIYSPISVAKSSIIADPFTLHSSWLLEQKTDLNVKVSNGLLQVAGQVQPTYLLSVSLVDEVYSARLQQSVLSLISDEQEKLAVLGITIQKAGLVLHAAAAAAQAKSEISIIGVGSLVGIIALIIWVFARLSSLMIMLLPLTIGVISAVAVTVLVFGNIHMITLAFGAGLIGVSIDYALHFMCHRYQTTARMTLKEILPGLFLGLLSSVLAYSAQALTPFPGLRQMAVFCVAGLVFSWLSVLFCFSYLSDITMKKPQTLDSNYVLKGEKLFARMSIILSRLNSYLLLPLTLFVLLGLSVLSLHYNRAVDDIRLLQSSPVELLHKERAVQKMLNVTSSSQFLLFTANGIEQNLQLEEQLAKQLNDFKKQGILEDYQALSQVLPSIKRQDENAQLVQAIYDNSLSSFYSKLQFDSTKVAAAEQELCAGISARLTPKIWWSQQQSERRQSFVIKHQGQLFTVLKIIGPVDNVLKQALQDIDKNHTHITYVNRVDDITTLLGDYREQMTMWVLAAYLLVFLILLLRYKKRVWTVVLPSIIASLLTLGIVAQIEQGINLFHIMALILVLGIGIDMGIFLTETKESASTWLAVSLSTITSLLAFGLLCLSETPVLHHFGLTVLIGLILVWVLSSIMRNKET